MSLLVSPDNSKSILTASVLINQDFFKQVQLLHFYSLLYVLVDSSHFVFALTDVFSVMLPARLWCRSTAWPAVLFFRVASVTIWLLLLFVNNTSILCYSSLVRESYVFSTWRRLKSPEICGTLFWSVGRKTPCKSISSSPDCSRGLGKPPLKQRVPHLRLCRTVTLLRLSLVVVGGPHKQQWHCSLP